MILIEQGDVPENEEPLTIEAIYNFNEDGASNRLLSFVCTEHQKQADWDTLCDNGEIDTAKAQYEEPPRKSKRNTKRRTLWSPSITP